MNTPFCTFVILVVSVSTDVPKSIKVMNLLRGSEWEATFADPSDS